MSKLIAGALLLGSFTGSAILFSAGCVSQAESDEIGNATLFATTDADAGPVLPKRGELVISEVYGYGGMTGASKRNDYVELYNKTSKAIPLEGLSIQTSTTPTTNFTIVLPLTGSIAAGGYFLVKLKSAGAGGTAVDLPTADQSDDDFDLGAKDGKVALVPATAALACGANGSLCAASKLLDLVGWGAASQIEGLNGVLPIDDAKKAAIRNNKGCLDAENNRDDFSISDADPQNAASDAYTCPKPPDAGVDSGPPREAAAPVKDPDLGPESAFDGGFRPEAGPTVQSGGGGDDCAVGSVGGPSGFSLFAPLAGLAIAAIAIGRRRRK